MNVALKFKFYKARKWCSLDRGMVIRIFWFGPKLGNSKIFGVKRIVMIIIGWPPRISRTSRVNELNVGVAR